MIAATRHDRFAAQDYDRLRRLGIATARDGVRWHLVERSPGRYDLHSLLPMVRAARDSGLQVIWDLCHYGWPEGLDVFRPEFVDRFADYARAVARLIAAETDEIPWFAPINEISFWSWAGGDVAYLNPFASGRGFELKAQLARAAVAAIDALWSVDERARILHCDPAIHIRPLQTGDEALAEAQRQAQFQAWDMLLGRLWPQLGGDERYLDVLGVNYYPNNQWFLGGPTIDRGDPCYRPFRDLLRDLWTRYGRPLIVAETGAQDAARAAWLAYVMDEVRAVRREGIPVLGLCLYPILDYPGWDDDRHCCSGLWGYPDPQGYREIDPALAAELARQMRLATGEVETLESQQRGPSARRGLGQEEIEHAEL